MQAESAFIVMDADIPVARLHYLVSQLHIRLILVHPDLASVSQSFFIWLAIVY